MLHEDKRYNESHRLTNVDYTTLLEEQDNRCAICHTPVEQASKDGRRLSIDHDHSCCPGHRSCGNCIRGLLCTSCNAGLGHFKDNPAILLSALRYLQEAQSFRLNESIEDLKLAYIQF